MNNNYTCDQCRIRMLFNSGETYEAHMKQWHQTIVSFRCDSCGVKLNSWQDYKLHWAQTHNQRNNATSVRTSITKVSSKWGDGDDFEENNSSVSAWVEKQNFKQAIKSVTNDEITNDKKNDAKLEAQNLTSFPNQNRKHIDYVLVFEEEKPSAEEEIKKAIRQAFNEALKNESFEIYRIEHACDNKKLIFILLNCPDERLLDEAEIMKIQMTLKNVSFLTLSLYY